MAIGSGDIPDMIHITICMHAPLRVWSEMKQICLLHLVTTL